MAISSKGETATFKVPSNIEDSDCVLVRTPLSTPQGGTLNMHLNNSFISTTMCDDLARATEARDGKKIRPTLKMGRGDLNIRQILSWICNCKSGVWKRKHRRFPFAGDTLGNADVGILDRSCKPEHNKLHL